MRKPQIKHIYFDLGNVIIPVKKDIVAVQLAKYSKLTLADLKKTFRHAYSEYDEDFWRLVYEFDRGQIYPEDFYRKVCEELKLEMSFDKFVEIWQMMMSIDRRFIELIKNAKAAGIRTGIISDLCLVHYNRAMQLLDRELFDICFFSFLENYLKAENDGVVFKRAIRAANFPPENILFVDDRTVNIEMAKKCGMKTFLYLRNFSMLRRFLKQYGLFI